ncbi:MAG: hypothetical protein ABI432_18095, partial [Flavobacteriales bacterium]
YHCRMFRPLPATGSASGSAHAYAITDLLGHTVASGSLVPGQHQMRMPAVAPGCYLFSLFDGMDRRSTQRLVVEGERP